MLAVSWMTAVLSYLFLFSRFLFSRISSYRSAISNKDLLSLNDYAFETVICFLLWLADSEFWFEISMLMGWVWALFESERLFM